MRARCNYHFGDFQRALYDYSVAIRLCETNEKEQKGNSNKLADYYSKCMHDLFFFADIISVLLDYAGVQHFELGQLDEALRHYDLAIKNDKN